MLSTKEIRPVVADEDEEEASVDISRAVSSSEGDNVPSPAAATTKISDSRCKHTKRVGKTSAYLTTALLLAYAITTLLGFASLENPDDPIEDPYFTIMELLILAIMPPMIFAMMVFRDVYSSNESAMYALASVVFMTLCAGITSCVHAVVLTVSRDFNGAIPGDIGMYLFSFQWPSVAYAADILAWDWFFGLSMIFGSLVVPWKQGTKGERSLRVLMAISGFLSVLGLIAVPLDNMKVRLIGIVGYAIVGIVVFLMMGFLR